MIATVEIYHYGKMRENDDCSNSSAGALTVVRIF